MPTLDQRKNFAKGIVSTGYDAAATTIVLATSEGAKFPSFAGNPFNVVWWNSTDFADPADDPTAEIVRVTARTGDTLTVTRAQESTVASVHNTSAKVYKMALCVTKKMIDDIEAVTTGLTKSAFFTNLATDQVIADGVETTVSFVDNSGIFGFDDGSLFNNTNHQFVCAKAGIYYVTALTSIVLNIGHFMYSRIYHNANLASEATTPILAVSSSVSSCVSAVLTLAVSDTVTIKVEHNDTDHPSLISAGNATSFSGFAVYNGT